MCPISKIIKTFVSGTYMERKPLKTSVFYRRTHLTVLVNKKMKLYNYKLKNGYI